MSNEVRTMSTICKSFIIFLLALPWGITINAQVLELKAIELILSKIAGHIFDQMRLPDKVYDIDGVPDWYLQNNDAEWYCSFSFASGGLDSIKKAEKNAEKELIIEQTKLIDSEFKDFLKQYGEVNSAEQETLNNLLSAQSTEEFVQRNSRILKVKYDRNLENPTAFAKSCVKREALWRHQRNKIAVISAKLNISKSDEFFENFNVAESSDLSEDKFKPKTVNNPSKKEVNEVEIQLKSADTFWKQNAE